MGTVRYRIGTTPLRTIEGKIWNKIHFMAINLNTWKVEDHKPLNLDFITHSCDNHFKSRAVLVGNIPLDYVAGGRMSEENISKIVTGWTRKLSRNP